MLNGDDNESGFKTNRSNYQKKKNKLHVQHTFFLLLAGNKFAREARFFVFPLPLFCTTTTLFCTTKTSNFLVTHYFYGGIVVCAYPIFCFLCSCSLLFFTALIFLLYIGMPLVRTNGRSLARSTFTWLPNFLRWVDYHISLVMGLRYN